MSVLAGLVQDFPVTHISWTGSKDRRRSEVLELGLVWEPKLGALQLLAQVPHDWASRRATTLHAWLIDPRKQCRMRVWIERASAVLLQFILSVAISLR